MTVEAIFVKHWVPWFDPLFNHNNHGKAKVKQSLYTPWRRLGGEEV
jgi:hypothetical protein